MAAVGSNPAFTGFPLHFFSNLSIACVPHPHRNPRRLQIRLEYDVKKKTVKEINPKWKSRLPVNHSDSLSLRFIMCGFQLQTPQSFAQSVNELVIALQRTGDLGNLARLCPHLELLANVDPSPGMWPQQLEYRTLKIKCNSGTQNNVPVLAVRI